MHDRPGAILSVSGRFGGSTLAEATYFLHISPDSPREALSFES